MNTNSNSYTIIYASVMVVIVAFLLAFVSSSLRETQNKNVQLDTKKQILAALNIKNVEDADAEYQKYVKGDMLMNVDGTLTENNGANLLPTTRKKRKNNNVCTCLYAKWTVRLNMWFLFMVQAFGVLSGDMLH